MLRCGLCHLWNLNDMISLSGDPSEEVRKGPDVAKIPWLDFKINPATPFLLKSGDEMKALLKEGYCCMGFSFRLGGG